MVFNSCHTILRFFVAVFFSFLSNVAQSQLSIPIVGTYKGKSAQGMAIWGDKAYLFNDGGLCRVLNLQSGNVIRELHLASSNKNTHVNAACFGDESIRQDGMPVIYISEYNLPSRCFVESIGDTTSYLLQTILAQEKGKDVWVQSWIIDTKEKSLYAVARLSPSKGETRTAKVRITKYRLPSLQEGTIVVLSEKDKKDSFIVEFASGTQGGVIKDGKMYLSSGLQESARGSFNAKRVIQVIDLKRRKIVKKIDLTYVTTNEPEDLDFYNGKLLLYCGQEGGLYKINL